MDETANADETINVIACIPVNTVEFGLPPFEPTEGYKVVECDCCHQWVHIGPKQLRLKLEGNVALCLLCIAQLAKEEGTDLKEMKVHQCDELLKPR